MRIARQSPTANPSVPAVQAADGELLALFVRHADERAFDRLVERHAPMVWRVCRRVLRNDHDAEDAFQATFLLLARHGRRVRASESLAGWLYRVAFRTALAARKRRLRLREAPLAGEPLSRERAFPDFSARLAQQALLEELAALPHKYRTALVMRYLEGRTRREIADETDQTIAAVQGRLARGTRLLRSRLVRRGVSLAVGVAAFSGARQATACPTGVVASATREAAALVAGKALGASAGAVSLYQQGVRAMLVSSIGKPMLAAGVVLAVLTAGFAVPRAGAGEGDQPAALTLDASLASAGDGDGVNATDSGIRLAAAEVAVEERPLERRVAEERVVEQRLVERPVEEPQGPVFRPEDLRSQERLEAHLNTIESALDELNQKIDEREGEDRSIDLLVAQRNKLMHAQELLELHEATLGAPEEYIDAILASARGGAVELPRRGAIPVPAGAPIELPRVPFVEVPAGPVPVEVELPHQPFPPAPPLPPQAIAPGSARVDVFAPVEVQLKALEMAQRQIESQREALERQIGAANGQRFGLEKQLREKRIAEKQRVEKEEAARVKQQAGQMKQEAEHAKQQAEGGKQVIELQKQAAAEQFQNSRMTVEEFMALGGKTDGFGSLGLVEHAFLASKSAIDSAEPMVTSDMIAQPEKEKSIARVRREYTIAVQLLDHWEKVAADVQSHPDEDAPSFDEHTKAGVLRAELEKIEQRLATLEESRNNP